MLEMDELNPMPLYQLEPLFLFFSFSFPFSKIKTRRNFRHHQCHKMTLDEIISFPPLALPLQSHSLHPLGKAPSLAIRTSEGGLSKTK